jgi:hypothetical protein
VRQTLAVVDWLSRTDAAPSSGGPGSGGRLGTVLAWVVGIGIVAALGLLLVDLVRDAGTLQSDLSGASEGVEAAGRITTVLATGDLTPPPGVARTLTPECGDSSAPSLRLGYEASAGAAPPLPAIEARLRARGWEPAAGGAPVLQKRFGDWTAFVSPGGAGGLGVVGLGVQGDFDASCVAFHDELAPILRHADR